jgi:predicted acetyltransferase
MHQIRVHLADAGHPILGDALYGGEQARQGASRVLLHASRLTIDHPVTGKRLSFSAPLPPDMEEAVQARAPLRQFALETPSIIYEKSFVRGARALFAEGRAWWSEAKIAAIESDLPEYLAELLASATEPPPGFVRASHFWGIVDGEFAGILSIRHELTDELRIVGGHIGYDVVPSFRRRGIATRMLATALPQAKAIGLRSALLTCDESNLGSVRAIEANGGRLEATREIVPGQPLKRYYWIDL